MIVRCWILLRIGFECEDGERGEKEGDTRFLASGCSESIGGSVVGTGASGMLYCSGYSFLHFRALGWETTRLLKLHKYHTHWCSCIVRAIDRLDSTYECRI